MILLIKRNLRWRLHILYREKFTSDFEKYSIIIGSQLFRGITVFSILASGTTEVLIHVLGWWVPDLHPENDVFFVTKAFTARVILSIGLVHILPDAFEGLTSSCVKEMLSQDFPIYRDSSLGGSHWDTCNAPPRNQIA